MSCPNCGAPGGGPAGCGSCGLSRDPNVGGAWNTGQTHHHRSGSSGSDCFPGDTLVLTPHGAKRIDHLDKGDVVIGVRNDGSMVPAAIKRKIAHKRNGALLHVVSENPELSFHVTRGHPVLTHRGWEKAKRLQAGDILYYVSKNGVQSSHTVKEVRQSDRVEPVFNLIVDKDATFAVSGCIAHSFVNFRALRVCANRAWKALMDLHFHVSIEGAQTTLIRDRWTVQ